MDDAYLATHLLHMCLVKWKTQYDLMENTTPVSTRAFLLVLKNIENNDEIDTKLSSSTKLKGLMGSTRWSLWTPAFTRNPKGGLDQKALCAMQEAWPAAQEPHHT